MDSQVEAVYAVREGRFEIKFKVGKFAGWDGRLAPALNGAVYSFNARGQAALPNPELLLLESISTNFNDSMTKSIPSAGNIIRGGMIR